MEHLIADYLREEWSKTGWLHKNQHGFRNGFSCESQIISLSQDIADALDVGMTVDAIVIDFSKAFDLVPHDILIKKLSTTGIDKRVVLWIREFLFNRTQRVRIDSMFSKETDITSGVAQGSVLGPLLFLAYINDLPQHICSNIRLFADDCVIYRIIHDNRDKIALPEDLDKIHDWVVENEMKINAEKSKIISFNRSRNREHRSYHLNSFIIPEKDTVKYLGITLSSDLNWATHVTNTTRKAWKSLNFVKRILKNGSNVETKSLAYTSLIRPVLEYASAAWDPYKKGQINELQRIQRKALKFINLGGNHNNLLAIESLEVRRKRARLGCLFKAVKNEPAWRDIQERIGGSL